MAFPERNFFGFPKGWKDLGEVRKKMTVENGRNVSNTMVHTYCNRVVHIGSENGKIFKFCQLCKIKTNDF